MCGRCNKTPYPSRHQRSQQLPKHRSLKRQFDEWLGGGKLLMPFSIVAGGDCIDATQGFRTPCDRLNSLHTIHVAMQNLDIGNGWVG